MSLFDKIKETWSAKNQDSNFQGDEENQTPPLPGKQKSPFYKNPLFWLVGIGSFLVAKKLFSSVKDTKRYQVGGIMLLTKNFRVGEFLRSAEIPELKDYMFTKDEFGNLKRLANVLQKIRDDVGAPIIITSGGRPPTLRATEGKFSGLSFVEILRKKNYSPAEFSQHMDFSAADFTCTDKRWLIDIVESMTGPYFGSAFGKTITQVILYIKRYEPNFMHLGVKSDINDFIRITSGKRLLLGDIKTDDEGNTISTSFIPYSELNLKRLLTSPISTVDIKR